MIALDCLKARNLEYSVTKPNTPPPRVTTVQVEHSNLDCEPAKLKPRLNEHVPDPGPIQFLFGQRRTPRQIGRPSWLQSSGAYAGNGGAGSKKNMLDGLKDLPPESKYKSVDPAKFRSSL
ncbi:hypothetical protein PCANC_28778 [Puccinia coronata f. sp. avenae]|uniref:Uncharacterized protein n=1 Tax=Puccinia coronata f. sp. avenae TaxID=200324 RepID=A0A2N5TIB0_9BASI|nr:hypothetical protein PCANC_28778 [Puccinia coronata f. sp. avenae]